MVLLITPTNINLTHNFLLLSLQVLLTWWETSSPIGPHRVGTVSSLRTSRFANPVLNKRRLLKQPSVKWRRHRNRLGKVGGIGLKMNSSHWLREGSSFGKAYKGDVPPQRRKHLLTIVNQNVACWVQQNRTVLLTDCESPVDALPSKVQPYVTSYRNDSYVIITLVLFHVGYAV